MIIFQENRTPDNLFHGLPALLPAADIADSGQNSAGQTITLVQVPLANTFDPSHSHGAFTAMYNNGAMNGADLIPCKPIPGTTARQTLRSHMSTQLMSHLILQLLPIMDSLIECSRAIRGRACRRISSLSAKLTTFGDEPVFREWKHSNMNYQNGGKLGCDASPARRIPLVGPDGMQATTHPCFDHATLTDS